MFVLTASQVKDHLSYIAFKSLGREIMELELSEQIWTITKD
jgi:hypothetical protein